MSLAFKKKHFHNFRCLISFKASKSEASQSYTRRNYKCRCLRIELVVPCRWLSLTIDVCAQGPSEVRGTLLSRQLRVLHTSDTVLISPLSPSDPGFSFSLCLTRTLCALFLFLPTHLIDFVHTTLNTSFCENYLHEHI